jgi:RimJ/RimL family protein N-acetyltransferase
VIELETERLLLRKPRLEDADAFASMYSDPEVMQFIGGLPEELDMAFVVRRWLGRWEANGVGPFVVRRREDGAVLGRTGFVVWDTRDWRMSTVGEAGEHAQPELGWAFARHAWGNGYATEAARAARAWAREKRAIGHLVSVISPENRRSQRVAEKLGAVPGETVELGEGGGPAVLWEHPR